MLVKQGIDVSFAQGLDQKVDPKRLAVGKFVSLQNTVFQKAGLLQKRNGYKKLASLPDTTYSYVTTLNNNLTAIGPSIAAYNQASKAWVSRGMIEPLSVNTLALLRNNLNQLSSDTAISDNGLVCTAYRETDGVTIWNKFVVADVATGQNIIAPRFIPVPTGTVVGGMRVFYFGTNFIIVFTNNIAGTFHLQYIAVNAYNTDNITVPVDIVSSYTPFAALNWDCVVVGSKMFFAYQTATLNITYMNTSLIGVTPVSFAVTATNVTMCADETQPGSIVIYAVFQRTSGTSGPSLVAVDTSLNTLVALVTVAPGSAVDTITAVAQNGVCSIAFCFGQLIQGVTYTKATAVSSAVFISIRSLDLASKAFIVDEKVYYLAAYNSVYQPTYFLIDASNSTQASPVIAAKIAYSNAGSPPTVGLPNVSVKGSLAQVSYRFKDLIAAVNKDTNVPAGTQTQGVYSQTGLNLASFTFGTDNLNTSEIANNLHITGGFLWHYDGYLPVEHNFFLWPNIGPTSQTDPTNTAVAVWSSTGGNMSNHPDGSTYINAYWYQVTYEWTDNQGNAYRSSPSIPIAVTTQASPDVVTGKVTLTIPTLRVTMKTANPVKIVIYRWSVGQQNYFQTTSITQPILNSTTADSVIYVDTNRDSTILGNNLIYTTGGVVEDVNAPSCDVATLWDTRLWIVDAEDRNVLWFSKQVIEATPVEMSDLLTVYIPPSVSTQGDTGPMKAIAPMDDKLIIGKENALLYINGTGPDNTGANNQYSPATLITSTVGCTNQRSIVLMPQGLMFQSDKGIWLLGRDLSTNYIGAQVEDLTLGAKVLSAVNVPETNQVRFTLDTGITLMYDYYFQQWGSFKGIPSLSSAIYGGLHTFIDKYGAAYQESPGSYLDGSNPVLIQFQTGPLRIGELQHYQRAYFFYLLGQYVSPHKLQVSLRYDYQDWPEQAILITPDNYSTPYGSGGSQSPYGEGDPYGGPTNLELWRVFLERQRCMAFSIEVQEIFDASLGITAGAGLTISGLNVVMGFKKPYRPQSAAKSAG